MTGADKGRSDPIALAVVAAAVLALAVGLWMLLAAVHRAAELLPPLATGDTAPKTTQQPPDAGPIAAPAPAAKPKSAASSPAPNQSKPSPAARAERAVETSADNGPRLAAGERWEYRVTLEPPTWQNARLVFEVEAKSADGRDIIAEFSHGPADNVARNAWRLGRFQAAHSGHAALRFPGVFLHAAHFPLPLESGKEFAWAYPWQDAERKTRPDRLRRYDARVVRWESVQVPAGRFEAARIEARLRYLDAGKTQAEARETIWYAPEVRQVVRVERTGRTPDENAAKIVAELEKVRMSPATAHTTPSNRR